MDDQHPTPFDDAELYDAIFEGFDYGIEFYLEQGRGAAGPVLDVACGTGRVLLPLLRAGIDADGLDAFPAMLERAHEKLRAAGLHANLHRADMWDFALPRRYALIIIPFNSFVHCLTAEHQIAALRVCREHLLPGGRLVFDIFFPGPDLLTQPQGVPVLEGEVVHPATGRTLRLYDSRSFDLVEQIQRSENEVRELNADGEVVRSHRFRTRIRWIYKQEMELLLRLAGYARWEVARAFDRAPLTGVTEAMLVIAEA